MKRTLLALALFAAACSPGLSADPGKPGVVYPDPGAGVVDRGDTPASVPKKAQDGRPPITINLDTKTLDLAATMVDAQPQWLELIATTPGGREHEAIVTIDVKPSQVHLALVTLGLEPGHPLRRRQADAQTVSEPPATEPPIIDPSIIEPPTGPELQLSFIYQAQGQAHETPVESWVIDRATAKPLPAGRWLFAGSTFKKWKGRTYYMADEAGNIASLVNFGDDLIVYQTDKTQDTDFQELQINPDIPLPYGSRLTLRIRIKPPQTLPDAPGFIDESPDKPGPAEP